MESNLSLPFGPFFFTDVFAIDLDVPPSLSFLAPRAGVNPPCDVVQLKTRMDLN